MAITPIALSHCHMVGCWSQANILISGLQPPFNSNGARDPTLGMRDVQISELLLQSKSFLHKDTRSSQVRGSILGHVYSRSPRDTLTYLDLQHFFSNTMTEPEQAEPVTPAPGDTLRKKRLTLQERLALAAKSKKKTGKQESIEPETRIADAEIRAGGEIDPGNEKPPAEKTENEPESAQIQTFNLELARLKVELSLLKLRNNSLVEENKGLKAGQNSGELERKLAEKDATIQLLMDEGQALSVKELKLNERIRTLATSNSKLEASLREYSEKNEETLLKLGEVEDLMKVHGLRTVDQLLDVLNSTSQQLAEAQASLDREKGLNWEGKYKELQRLYESELGEKKTAHKELDDARMQLQMLRNQYSLELLSKEELVAHLSQEILNVKDENSTEIARLESKLEGLRAENESFLKMSQNGNTQAADDEADLKQIEYREYAKLSETHRNLQTQYVSSQENWKLIESNLLSKVDSLATSLELLKKGKLKASTELRKLSTQLASLGHDTDALKAETASLRSENKELAFQLLVKANEYSDLEAKLDELKAVFATDRHNHDARIQLLTETIQKFEEQAQLYQSSASVAESFSTVHSRRRHDSGLHLNLEPGIKTPSRNFSYNSALNGSFCNTPGTGTESRFEAKFAESRYEPPTPGFGIHYPHNYSATSLDEHFEPSDTVSQDESYAKENMPNSGGTKNIQLINKMSSSIRRLEVELLGLREENEQLTRQKDQAQQQIVEKSALDREVVELQSRMAQLSAEIAEKAKREQDLLELIGEKSERVAELQADVLDLKDLCRQQVQQMIGMGR